MNEPTPSELNQMGIDEAARRHTPAISELQVQRHSDIRFKEGPVDCDGELQVLDVSGAWQDYSHVFVRCAACRQTAALANPRRRQPSAPVKPARPDFKMMAAGDKDDPF